MHELSIACELVDLAEASARTVEGASVRMVHLRLGALAGVDVEALRIGFATAIVGTLLADADLVVEETAAAGWCPQCAVEREPIDVQWLACPVCLAPLAHLVCGREIEITALELFLPDEAAASVPGSGDPGYEVTNLCAKNVQEFEGNVHTSA